MKATLKNSLPILLLGALLLSACGGGKPGAESSAAESSAEETTEARVIDVVSESVPETESAAEETEEVPPEPGLMRSALTHEWIPEELAKKRPIAVMYPIDKKAQPQYGLNRVSVFYEILEEGGMSRQMGILEDWEDLERIGNVRSIRDYFIYMGLEWDAVIVHFGGPEIFVKPMLTRADVDNVNGVGGVMGSDYGAFFRIPANSKSEHTAYTSGKRLLAAIEKAGFSREHREEYWQPKHWKFAPAEKPYSLEDHPDAVDATEIDMSGCYPVTKTTLRYDPETRLYYRSIYGSAQKDAVTKEQLSFSNVVIETAVSGTRGGSLYMYFHVLDSMQDGYFLTGGKMIHVTWMKNHDYEPTRFFDDSGEEVTMNTGRTMVFITQDGKDSFTANGVKYDI